MRPGALPRGGAGPSCRSWTETRPLRPSPTDDGHHVRKLERYKRVAGLETYLVFDGKVPLVRAWRRTVEGWPSSPVVLGGRDVTMDLPAIAAAIRLADVYS